MNMAQLIRSVSLVTVIATSAASAQAGVGLKRGGQWRALHLIGYGSDADLEVRGRNVPGLAALGVNVLILEVNYNFSFRSHPAVSRESASQMRRKTSHGHPGG
jgi:hypothetical protein